MPEATMSEQNCSFRASRERDGALGLRAVTEDATRGAASSYTRLRDIGGNARGRGYRSLGDKGQEEAGRVCIRAGGAVAHAGPGTVGALHHLSLNARERAVGVARIGRLDGEAVEVLLLGVEAVLEHEAGGSRS